MHDDLPERKRLLEKYDRILLAGAMGPWEAGEKGEPEDTYVLETWLAVLKENIRKYKVRFIGEIGLDYYWEYGSHEAQHMLFETQMAWASEMGLKVLIHDRDADEDTIEIIRRLGPPKGGVLHCFNGCRNLMDTALERGYFISFAGNLTYRSNDHLRRILKDVPRDRLLLETDAPYLAPVPMRGKPNSPAYIVHTYECAAQTLGMPFGKLAELVADNFIRFTSSC